MDDAVFKTVVIMFLAFAVAGYVYTEKTKCDMFERCIDKTIGKYT